MNTEEREVREDDIQAGEGSLLMEKKSQQGLNITIKVKQQKGKQRRKYETSLRYKR